MGRTYSEYRVQGTEYRLDRFSNQQIPSIGWVNKSVLCTLHTELSKPHSQIGKRR